VTPITPDYADYGDTPSITEFSIRATEACMTGVARVNPGPDHKVEAEKTGLSP